MWWIAPHGIRADLRKTVPASVFFQADCQEEKRLGGGVRENRGGDGRGMRVVGGGGRGGEASRDSLRVLNPQDKLSLRTSTAPELDIRGCSLGHLSCCMWADQGC